MNRRKNDYAKHVMTYIDENGDDTGEEVETDGNPTLMEFMPVFVLSCNNLIRELDRESIKKSRIPLPFAMPHFQLASVSSTLLLYFL